MKAIQLGAIAAGAVMLGTAVCGVSAYADDLRNMNTTSEEIYHEVSENVVDGGDTVLGPSMWVESPSSKKLRTTIYNPDRSKKYQIRYSANKNMKGATTLNVSSKSGVKTFKVGFNDKKYFIELRVGTLDKGKVSWGKWEEKVTGAAIAPPKIASISSPATKTIKVKVANVKGKKASGFGVEYTASNWEPANYEWRIVSKKTREKTIEVGGSKKVYKVRAYVMKEIGGEFFSSAPGPIKTVKTL